MNRDEALKLWGDIFDSTQMAIALEEFATRVERMEREACAKAVADERLTEPTTNEGDEAYNLALTHAVSAINLRSNVEVSGLARLHAQGPLDCRVGGRRSFLEDERND